MSAAIVQPKVHLQAAKCLSNLSMDNRCIIAAAQPSFNTTVDCKERIKSKNAELLTCDSSSILNSFESNFNVSSKTDIASFMQEADAPTKVYKSTMEASKLESQVSCVIAPELSTPVISLLNVENDSLSRIDGQAEKENKMIYAKRSSTQSESPDKKKLVRRGFREKLKHALACGPKRKKAKYSLIDYAHGTQSGICGSKNKITKLRHSKRKHKVKFWSDYDCFFYLHHTAALPATHHLSFANRKCPKQYGVRMPLTLLSPNKNTLDQFSNIRAKTTRNNQLNPSMMSAQLDELTPAEQDDAIHSEQLSPSIPHCSNIFTVNSVKDAWKTQSEQEICSKRKRKKQLKRDFCRTVLKCHQSSERASKESVEATKTSSSNSLLEVDIVTPIIPQDVSRKIAEVAEIPRFKESTGKHLIIDFI